MGLDLIELLTMIYEANYSIIDSSIEEISHFSIYTAFKSIYPNDQVWIVMELFLGKSPFDYKNEDSALMYVKEIENLISEEHGLKKPIVSIYQNQTNNSWDLMVILPRESETPPKIFFRNSKNLNPKIPPQIKFLLENKLNWNEEGSENIIGGELNGAQIVDEQDFAIRKMLQPNEGGWWAMLRAIMVIRTKCENNLKRMISWTSAFYAMRNYFKENGVALNLTVPISSREDNLSWIEKQRLLIRQTLKEKNIIFDIKTDKTRAAPETITAWLEFSDKINSHALYATPMYPLAYNNIGTSILESNIKIKEDWQFGFGDFFDRLVNQKSLVVDKTLFIKEILDCKLKNILITRPRKWGKSLNLDMLRVFLNNEGDEVKSSKNKALFTRKRNTIINGLSHNSDTQQFAIATERDGYYVDQYAGKFPVVFITFPTIICEDGQDIHAVIHESFGYAISSAYKDHVNVYEEFNKRLKLEHSYILEDNFKKFHGYLFNDPNSDLGLSVLFLCEMLYNFYQKKVFVLIDDYDSPFSHLFHKKNYRPIINFMQKMIGYLVKDGKEYVKMTIMAGILKFAAYDTFSYFTNINVNSVLFSKYFGFTEKEVNMILRKASIWNTEADLKLNKKKIDFWYDGYNIGGKKIYNPWSIFNCLSSAQNKEREIFKLYWIGKENHNKFRNLFSKFVCEKELFELLMTRSLRLREELPTEISLKNVGNKKYKFFGFLLHTGYLTDIQKSKENNPIRRIVRSGWIKEEWIYTIPNNEVKEYVFDIIINNWLENLTNIRPNLKLKKLTNLIIKNLDKTEKYSRIIENQVLDSWGSENNIEIDFQILFGWSTFAERIPYVKESRHMLFNGFSSVKSDKTCAIYIPLKDKSTYVVAHEYKKLFNATEEQAQNNALKAIIKFYHIDFMHIALSSYENNSFCNYFTHVIFRGIVFYQITKGQKWNLTIIEKIHRISDAIKIRDYLRQNKNMIEKRKNESDLADLMSIIVGQVEEKKDNCDENKERKRKHMAEDDVMEKFPKLSQGIEIEESEGNVKIENL